MDGLNAGPLDDREAGSFADGTGGVATDADKLDGKDSSQLLGDNVAVRNNRQVASVPAGQATSEQ